MVLRILKNAFLGLLLVIMTLSALAGVAAAVWSAIGAGTGSGTTGTTVAVTITPATPSTFLYPGGTADVVLSMANSNVSTVRIGSLAIDTSRGTTGFEVDASHSGCVLSSLSFTTQTNGSTGWTIPAKVGSVSGTLAVSLTNAVAMSFGAVSACQGATFTIFLIGQP
jgi:hypothetical protein